MKNIFPFFFSFYELLTYSTICLILVVSFVVKRVCIKKKYVICVIRYPFYSLGKIFDELSGDCGYHFTMIERKGNKITNDP